jgi:hypothetical protein
MNSKVSLIPIDRHGAPRGYAGSLPELAGEVFRSTAELSRTVGFDEPWIGYLAVSDEAPVGTCGFKSPPQDERVEIAIRGRGGTDTSGA